jgi:hypothetical protein
VTLTQTVVVSLALLAFGCHKGPTEGGVRIGQVNDSLAAAGFKVGDFKPTDPARFSAQKCSAGMLDGVDTVVCEFGSAEAAVLGKKAADAWLGQVTTGAVLANGKTILCVADRNRSDPNGKTIHRLTKTYSAVQ